MTPRFLTIVTGRNLPKIRQPHEPEPSTINENTIANFTRVVEQTGILEVSRVPPEPTMIARQRSARQRHCLAQCELIGTP